MKDQFNLGEKLRCKVTGFTGIATSRLEYLTGCVQYCLKPRVGDSGGFPDGNYIDFEQLEYIDSGISRNITPTESGGESISEGVLHGRK